MPPKPRFTADEIAVAALALVKEQGVEALTARNLAAKLDASARPIFTVFKSMDEVRRAARELALREFEQYFSDYERYTPAFKHIGMQMVSYGIREPELFKLLFMQEHSKGISLDDYLSELGSMAQTSIRLIGRDYHLNEADAKTLFEQMWVHTFALGALCAMHVCDFSEAEIAEKLGQVFGGLLTMLRSGKIDQYNMQPRMDGALPDLREGEKQ